MYKCKVINGKESAASLTEGLKHKVDTLKNKFALEPCLAVVLVGEDPASKIYVSNKVKRARQLGIKVFEVYLNSDTEHEELVHLIKVLNADARVHGILVQLPLPSSIKTDEILGLISPEKDIDGFHPTNVGKVYLGLEALTPCTAIGVIKLIKEALGNDLSGLSAVIIGRSRIVGRPTAALLLNENCTVTILHSRSKDLKEYTKKADILVSATGKPNSIDASFIKPGACVIDVGITRIDNKLTGDIDFDSVSKVAGFLTPVPKGVGPMTIACVLENTIKACCALNKLCYEKL